MLESGAGRLGTRPKTRQHPLHQLIEVFVIRGPHEETPGGIIGHNVRYGATVGDDAVDPRVRPDVLAQGGDAHISDDQRIQCVDAVLRLR